MAIDTYKNDTESRTAYDPAILLKIILSLRIMCLDRPDR
jgi:hypothetical protein